MSDNQERKLRFFIVGDIVRHTKTGSIYTVGSSMTYEDEVHIFYEYNNDDCDVEVYHDQFGYINILFNELEIVESSGVYMGAGLKSPTDEPTD